ncbi:hypothetical protein Daus18300_012159 [Diaporthe australafricana]|uniref:Uncharacterized protein n=1 Tax=Diaporthe australafricana TaxID=127596 RepID=A0ABR3W3V3_9PEZI
MVNFAAHALAALAFTALVAAVPTTTSTAPFTFVQWVEDIIANPDGDHLSPEEAVAAKNAAVAAGPIKRVNCEQSLTRANADDAAACLDDLARLGSQGVSCVLTEFQYSLQMCRIGNARIVGSKSTGPTVGTNCSKNEEGAEELEGLDLNH